MKYFVRCDLPYRTDARRTKERAENLADALNSEGYCRFQHIVEEYPDDARVRVGNLAEPGIHGIEWSDDNDDPL